MGKHLKFISSQYLDSYSSKCKINWLEVFHKLRSKSTFTTDDFEYYLIASSLYSSKIEGNSLDANSFFRNRGNKTFPKKKEVQEIEDLVKAYKFASENNLNKTNFLKTHEISAKTLLPANLRGKVRKQQVGVHDTKSLKPVYLAVEPQFVNEELSKLFADISELLIKLNGLQQGNPKVVTFPKSKFYCKILTFGILDETLKGILIGF
jgi:hypothetical protein